MPHYELNGQKGSIIRAGDWVMIDAHAHVPGKVFADITWVGFAGPSPTAQHQRVFDAVIGARDAAADFMKWRAFRYQETDYDLPPVQKASLISQIDLEQANGPEDQFTCARILADSSRGDNILLNA